MPSSRSRTILLTGASAGLGAALARHLAPGGHRLALVARRAERLERLAEVVRARGADALVLPADLAHSDMPASVVAATVEHFGSLDVLINNAGIGLPGYFGQSDPDALRRQVTVNFVAPMLLARHALPHLLNSRGTIICVGSAITFAANPIFGAYGATKAGLAYWTDALRRELRHRGVHVSLVELGPVGTEFFDAVRLLDQEGRALGIGPPPDAVYNALRDRPPALLTIDVELAAKRIVRLLDRPRRRLALPRRVVWPFRLVGALFQLAPALGDLAISAMIKRVESERSYGEPQRSSSKTRAKLGSQD